MSDERSYVTVTRENYEQISGSYYVVEVEGPTTTTFKLPRFVAEELQSKLTSALTDEDYENDPSLQEIPFKAEVE